jgi:hypothetical protein
MVTLFAVRCPLFAKNGLETGDWKLVAGSWKLAAGN